MCQHLKDIPLLQTTNRSFQKIWSDVCISAHNAEQVWVSNLRQGGVKAAHPDDGWVNRIIEIIGTGNPISMAGLTPEGQWERKFIGTVVMREVSLVWHVFERVPCS